MKKIILITLLSFAITQPSFGVLGYLREVEMSFCMDDCGQYYIEHEVQDGLPIFIIFPESFENIELFINRFVEVGIGQEVNCVECNAYEVESIILSDDCFYPVDCFQDPCIEAEDCQVNTPTECIANFCSGCYPDFYDLNGNLIDCSIDIEECIPPLIDIEGHCLHSGDLMFLQDMIDNSLNSGVENSPNIFMDSGDSWHEVNIDGEFYNFSSINGIVEPLELGIQEWNNGRLTSLMCGAYIYCNLSGEIPSSISNLSEVNVLRLEVNYFSGYLPESICELEQLNYNDNLDFDLSYNQLCPPYPDCIPNDALSYMEPSNCYIFGDINNDLEVNVLDIVIIVSYVLMTDYPTNMELYVGDINFDGELNILDIVAIVQLIMSPVELPEDCYIEPEIGPCFGLCPTYYYNQDTDECEEFITGCCGVEAFNSLNECQSICE
tara:strand:- start:1879 stop:3189 length:1311 start_codon:yes stop_codon:yes gene_type:complete